MSYRPDMRAAADVLAELAGRAGATPLPESLWTEDERRGAEPPPTWADLLAGDPTEPSQALLAALAGVHAGLVEHVDALAPRARAALMEERLGIERLPVVPDRVVVVVDGDPKRTPVVLPKGSLLKAGRTARGERLYETAETLTVLAAPVLGAHAHRRFPGAPDVAARRTPADAPFPAFADATAPAAVHELYLASDLLRFGPGRHELTLTLSGVRVNGVAPALAPVAAVVGALDWRISTAAGDDEVGVTSAEVSGDGVRLELAYTGATAARPLAGTPQTYLRAGFPAGAATGFSRETALGLGFGAASLSVHGVDLQPEAAFCNDGLLNVKKEFEPFGPVPRRGDSFLLRLDEAFAKPLARVQVTLTRLDTGAGVVGAHYGRSRAKSYAKRANEAIKAHGGDYEIGVDLFEDDAFQLRWERYAGDDWSSFYETGSFESIDRAVSVSGPFSQATTIGSVEGRFVRALLFNGDFGWSSFEETLADNVRKISSGDGGSVTTVTPPDPPLVSRVRVSYWSAALTSGDDVKLLARNGLERPAPLDPGGGAGSIRPFSDSEDAYEASLYVGISERLPAGELVALYAGLDEAFACPAVPGPASFAWEYRRDTGWAALPCVDGTLGLRQSGVVRFAAPLDWAVGAADVDETAGRWLRARTSSPGMAGLVRVLRTDAVEAVYRLAPGHESDDATPGAPLPAGGVTALRTAVPGLKKVTNPLPSWGGRGPEPDGGFFARSGGVLRHRARAVTPWDVEELLLHEFPQLALVRCLPHHGAPGSADSECRPGSIAVLLVPRSEERTPYPSVQLVADVQAFLGERGPVGVAVELACPAYAEVGVRATVELVRDVAAGEAREQLTDALAAFLHPLSTVRPGGGEVGLPLFRSVVVRFLEEQSVIDFVHDLDFLAPNAGLDRIDVDACRGLIASAAVHELFAQAAV